MNTVTIHYNTALTFRNKFSKVFFFIILFLDHKHYYNFGFFPTSALFSLAYVGTSTLSLFGIIIC